MEPPMHTVAQLFRNLNSWLQIYPQLEGIDKHSWGGTTLSSIISAGYVSYILLVDNSLGKGLSHRKTQTRNGTPKLMCSIFDLPIPVLEVSWVMSLVCCGPLPSFTTYFMVIFFLGVLWSGWWRRWPQRDSRALGRHRKPRPARRHWERRPWDATWWSMRL